MLGRGALCRVRWWKRTKHARGGKLRSPKLLHSEGRQTKGNKAEIKILSAKKKGDSGTSVFTFRPIHVNMKWEVTHLNLIKENQSLNNRLQVLIKGKGCPWNSVPECVDGVKISPCFKKLAYVFVKKGGSSLCLIKVFMQKICASITWHTKQSSPDKGSEDFLSVDKLFRCRTRSFFHRKAWHRQ